MQSKGVRVRKTEATAGIQWVDPKNWQEFGPIMFRLQAIPDQAFMLVFPEWFTSNEIGVWAPFEWNKAATARSWIKDQYSATLTFRFAQSCEKLELKWECEFRNGADKALTDLAAFNCLALNWAPLFKDLAMERTWGTDQNGSSVLLKDVAKTQGQGKRTMQFYPATDGIDLEHTEKIADFGVISTACLSGDRIGVESKDGRWLVETIVEGPVAYFFNNWEANHGCIHAAPLFGTVEPGESSIATGRIVFTRLK